jgi:hypothetical protein
MQVRRRWIETGLDPERPAQGELGVEVADDVLDAAEKRLFICHFPFSMCLVSRLLKAVIITTPERHSRESGNPILKVTARFGFPLARE